MKEFFNNLKFVWKYAKESRIYLVILSFIYLFDIALNVITPILSAKIIIELTSNNYMRIILIAFIIFIIDFLTSLIHHISRTLTIKMRRNSIAAVEIDLGKNILELENKCLDENGTGVFIQRLTNDTSRITDVFDSLLSTLSQSLKDIGIFVAIFIINKLVFVFIIITMITLYYLEKIRTEKRNKDDKLLRECREKVTSFIGELVRGARDIKMLNSEDDFVDELKNRIITANDKTKDMHTRSSLYSTITWWVSDFFSFLLIVLLVVLMEKEVIISSVALIIYNYANNVKYSIYRIGYILEYTKDFNLSCQRIKDIMEERNFIKESFGTKHIDKVKGDFEFKNVTFGYNRKKVLKNLSFKIKANETVAFVGKSGSGKTTIFNLLSKMYDIKSGRITIDGINIKELDKDTIRGNITIISQNPYIFNMSIKENLKIVKKDLTDQEMIKACKIACLDDYIKTLPKKYDTIIGEGGINLSGGQKQRLAIARALVQKTEIILFDEATSALDNTTQNKIQKAIDNMKNEYTILIIAHRLSTIINCNRILFLEDGKIIAEGTHNYLLKNCRQYKELYKSELTKNK